jgi:hypothetical protein
MAVCVYAILFIKAQLVYSEREKERETHKKKTYGTWGQAL